VCNSMNFVQNYCSSSNSIAPVWWLSTNLAIVDEIEAIWSAWEASSWWLFSLTELHSFSWLELIFFVLDLCSYQLPGFVGLQTLLGLVSLLNAMTQPI
jgi:hypothetical protein